MKTKQNKTKKQSSHVCHATNILTLYTAKTTNHMYECTSHSIHNVNETT